MCGIVGYIGNKEAVPILLEGLKRLEYRGYDSAGIAVLSNGEITVRRCPGNIAALEEILKPEKFTTTLGVSHTRWATHGVPNERNAHPHSDCTGKIAVVHNGIIENYEALKEKLIEEGHKFSSDTDTEVVAHLLEKYYKGSIKEAVQRAIKDIRGSYALGVISKDEPDILIGTRSGSPLIVGVGKGENFIASDVPAILKFTRDVIYVEDGEVICLNRKGVEIFDGVKKPIVRKPSKIKWSVSQAEKGGFKHFMLKEISEQPETIQDTLIGRISRKQGGITLDELKELDDKLTSCKKIIITACGTAYHAGLVGKYMIEELSGVPVEIDVSSEFRYRNQVLDGKETIAIAISQSGETADTLAGVRKLRTAGIKVISICNVLGSTLTRESDAIVYTHAGPEIAVASTKAYTSQLTVLALIALHLAKLKGKIDGERIKELIKALDALPRQIEYILKDQKEIRRCAKKYHGASQFLMLGRHYNYPTALEGALKLKEISYIHAEGYAAGELKHGPIALIERGKPIVVVATDSHVYDKVVSNIQEARARQGVIIAIATKGNSDINSRAEHTIYVPKTEEFLTPILAVIPLQLLAYYIAIRRGCEVDKPRNLAKSVTVE